MFHSQRVKSKYSVEKASAIVEVYGGKHNRVSYSDVNMRRICETYTIR